MSPLSPVRRTVVAVVLTVGAVAATAAGPWAPAAAVAAQGGARWSQADTVTPPALLAELRGQPQSRPIVVFTGPVFLYRTGHVPGAVLIGPTSTAEGLARLRAWAQGQPRTANIVVYCGCCPLQVCPNLAPSFTTLRGMGFTRVRILMLPVGFGADWASRGLPIER